MRWESGGVSGGSCWESSNPQPYDKEEPNFEVLDLVLKEICPNISYLSYKKIESLIESNEDTEWEYYGNYTSFGIKYITLPNLIETLRELNISVILKE